jgi:hypothetical protein
MNSTAPQEFVQALSLAHEAAIQVSYMSDVYPQYLREGSLIAGEATRNRADIEQWEPPFLAIRRIGDDHYVFARIDEDGSRVWEWIAREKLTSLPALIDYFAASSPVVALQAAQWRHMFGEQEG